MVALTRGETSAKPVGELGGAGLALGARLQCWGSRLCSLPASPGSGGKRFHSPVGIPSSLCSCLGAELSCGVCCCGEGSAQESSAGLPGEGVSSPSPAPA